MIAEHCTLSHFNLYCTFKGADLPCSDVTLTLQDFMYSQTFHKSPLVLVADDDEPG